MRLIIAAAMALVMPLTAMAQETRFELGQRLRAFELEWDSVADAAARKRALPHLKQATTSFFSAFLTGQQEEAGRGLDLARLSLRGKDISAETLWAESCVVRLPHRVTERAELEVLLARFYKPRGEQPEGLRFSAQLVPTGKPNFLLVGMDVKKLPSTLTLSLRDVKEGDYTLFAATVWKGKFLTRSEQTLSVAPDLKSRLEKVAKALESANRDKTTDYFTAKSLLALLEKLANGATLETNYPAARLLSETESLLKALAAGKTYFDKDRTGQHWLTVAVKERPVPVRIQVPAAAKKGKPLPLVIALHGVGGSENMFFDGYGHGAIARLSAERGWFLVATRGGLTEGLIGELAKLYPIDTKKVFLVGHSMGAGQAVAAASNNPERFAGVAALGGGGTVRPSQAVAKVAFFVGIGKEDFVALRAGQALKSSLERAKIEKMVYKEYDGIEHIVIVQHCLPEVFALFDEIVKR